MHGRAFCAGNSDFHSCGDPGLDLDLLGDLRCSGHDVVQQ
jgi:hypothetical protein